MRMSSPTPDTPIFHPGYVRVMAGVLQERGLDLRQWLSAAGLCDEAALAARAQPFSLREVDALVAAAMHAGEGPWLGLELGQALSLSTHGPLGYALASSPDLRHALSAVQRFGAVRNASLRYTVRDSSDGCELAVEERLDLGPTRGFYLSAMCVIVLQAIQAVVGPAVRTVQLHLPLPETDWKARIERHFAGTVRYDASRLVFCIHESLLRRPGLTADPQAHVQALESCERQAAAMASGRDDRWAGRVRELLRGSAAKAQPYASLESAARHFSMSSRTLIRKLEREGTSFQALLDESRKQRAWWYLLHSQQTVAEIAIQLGYQDARNFSRSFRRWHGCPPTAVRRLQSS